MKVRGCIALLLSAAALTFMLLLNDCSGKRQMALAFAQRQADAQRRQDEAVQIAESARVERAREVEAQRVQAAQENERRKQRGRTLIEAVTRNCETGTVKTLLDQGVDFDEEDYNGRTALMLAARYGCLDIIKMMITHNVTINHKNHWDMTALDWAEQAERGNPREIQDLLIKNGAKNGMNRIAGNPDSRVSVADTPKPPPAENPSTPVAPPKLTLKTHEELISEIKAKLERGEPITGDEGDLWNRELMKPKTITTGTTIQIGEIPKPPKPGSLEALNEAIARGGEVAFKVKYDNAVYPYHYLHDGVLTVSKTAVTFDNEFTVSPDEILKLTNQPQEASRIVLKVAVKNARSFFGKDIAGKKDFYFYNLGATTVGVGPGGTGISIACDGCDDSMNILYELLKKFRGGGK